MSLPVLIVGGGGHAKVLIEALHLRSVTILGILDADPALVGQKILGIPVIGGDEKATEYPFNDVRLVNGMGSVDVPDKRIGLFEKFKNQGFSFATVIHPSAVIASDVKLGEGTQIMAGAVIQPGSRIGRNVIINTRASIDHDCQIGDHVHVAPGATLSGGVSVGSKTHIGTGATVIQGIRIGSGSIVGAGALVLKNVPDSVTITGVPSRVVNK